ncbi:MAG: hypothetical protein ABIH90_00455 [Candidatus Aenigmatarchaeota archaeon]
METNGVTIADVLKQYAIGLNAGIDPKPYLTAEQVHTAVENVGRKLYELAESMLPSGGILYMFDIPRGGTRATTMSLKIAEKALGQSDIGHSRFSLPVSNYGDRGSTAVGPSLPTGFELGNEVISSIQGKILVTVDDILETGSTIAFARDYLIALGAADVYPLFIFGRAGRERPPYPVQGIGHELETGLWVAGAEVMDAAYGIGRNIPELHVAYPEVVSGFLSPDEIAGLDREKRERRAAFWGAIDALRGMHVDGEPAREVIENMSPMTYSEIVANL